MTTTLDTGNVLGIFAILVSIGGVVYTAVNHKRFRMKCCGQNLDVSVDVEDTSHAPPQHTQSQPQLKDPSSNGAPKGLKSQDEEIYKSSPIEEAQPEPIQKKSRGKRARRFSASAVQNESSTNQSIREQNIEEHERNEDLKAKYVLRVAEARRYNRNHNQNRVTPSLPPLPPSPPSPQYRLRMNSVVSSENDTAAEKE